MTTTRPRWLSRALGFPPPSAASMRRRYGTLGALFAPEVSEQVRRRSLTLRQTRELAQAAADRAEQRREALAHREADVIDLLSRAYSAAYIACATDDGATDWQCSRAALRAVVAHLREHLEDAAEVLGGTYRPGRWWSVISPEGRLWCGTSDEDEARAAVRPGDQLRRKHYLEVEAWRDVD